MKYCLIDTFVSGHHWSYNSLVIAGLSEQAGSEILYCSSATLSSEQKAFLKEKNVSFLEFEYDESEIKTWIQLFRYRVSILKKLFAYCKTENVDKVLFLYADGLRAALSATRLYARKFGVYYFVHWLPVRMREKVLFSLAKCDKVVVHTEYIKQKMPKRLRNKTKCVNYPMVDASPALNGGKASAREDTARKTLLYFGGTRYDKGLDIFLKALAKITVDCDLIIAGSENYFKEAYIREALQACPHVKNAEIMLRFVSDEEMDACYCQADIVVIPYRKNFRGESGVLLDAICHEKIIVAADIMHFKEYIDEAKSGIVFEAENIDDLTENLETAISDYSKLKSGQDCEEFKKMHTSENFKREIREIIAITG